MDHNAQLKSGIAQRMRKVNNPKVSQFMRSFLMKVDAAGETAGIWLEQLESRWGEFSAHPQSATAKFEPQDFDDLWYVIYGTKRKA